MQVYGGSTLGRCMGTMGVDTAGPHFCPPLPCTMDGCGPTGSRGTERASAAVDAANPNVDRCYVRRGENEREPPSYMQSLLWPPATWRDECAAEHRRRPWRSCLQLQLPAQWRLTLPFLPHPGPPPSPNPNPNPLQPTECVRELYWRRYEALVSVPRVRAGRQAGRDGAGLGERIANAGLARPVPGRGSSGGWG